MADYYPSREQFEAYRGRGSRITVSREILADFETPVSAYLKTSRGGYSFLLESVEGGERLGRYSFIGSEPGFVLSMKAGRATLTHPATGQSESFTFEDPLETVDRYLKQERPVPLPGMPRFQGGAVGYLAYECATYFEKLPVPALDDLGLPDAVLMFSDTVIAFDHIKHNIIVMTRARLDGDPRGEYDAAVERIESLIQRLSAPVDLLNESRVDPVRERAHAVSSRARRGGAKRPREGADTPEPGDEASRRFIAAVHKIKEYIRAGDCIQVVPSQRLARPLSARPFDVYRALRTINPSPYMFHLDLNGFQITGASPEMLVRVEDRRVFTRPLAGTRPRGRTREEDAALRKELLADEKERAEHIMLVDLARNDLGRVCAPGTVRVNTLMDVEDCSHVMHLVSGVEGVLRDDLAPIDALRAAFPAGTLSGAPKIRAMEIIAEIEPARRGPYGGAVGYFNYSGDLDTAITIRTIVLKDGVAYVQAGAGIVADSEAALEHRECMNKAAALIRALDDAQEITRREAREGKRGGAGR